MSQQQLDLAKANYDAANATVAGAVANVTQAEAQVSQKDAAVTVAQTNLNYTVIRSPIDGTVVARNVDVGQTVAASLQAPTIFTIAQDLSKMWVYAKTDESDVGNIKIGKPVTFKVDAFPKDTFHGIVSQVRMNATTVQSVVTYDTIIEFANPELKLFPGMTAYVTIPVATVQNVLEASQHRPALQTAHDHRRDSRDLQAIWNRSEVSKSKLLTILPRERRANRAVRAESPSRAESRYRRRLEAPSRQHHGARQGFARNHGSRLYGNYGGPEGPTEGRRRSHHPVHRVKHLGPRRNPPLTRQQSRKRIPWTSMPALNQIQQPVHVGLGRKCRHPRRRRSQILRPRRNARPRAARCKRRNPARRIRGHHGRERQRQVHLHEHAWLSRPPELRTLPARRNRRFASTTRRRWR